MPHPYKQPECNKHYCVRCKHFSGETHGCTLDNNHECITAWIKCEGNCYFEPKKWGEPYANS